MATPEQLARQFQAAVEQGNVAALRRLTEGLARALPDLVKQAEEAAARVAALREEGKDAEAATYAATRARAIAQQVATEVRQRVAELRPELLNGQAQAVEAGLAAAERLTAATFGAASLQQMGVPWSRPPLEAVQALQGAFGTDGPLPGLLNQIAPDTARRVRETLTTGMLAGKGPRVIARSLRQEVGLSAVRAETIARTETLRAYRAASQASYERNSDVVTSFRRLAAKSIRTCPMCLALDGQVQRTNEVMAVHPNDRCAVVPITKSFRELGIDLDEPPQPARESGSEWFARQPEAVQRTILGKGGLAAYQQGASLRDFVRVTNDPHWGPTVRRATLTEVAQAGAAFDKTVRAGDLRVVVTDEGRQAIVRRALTAIDKVHRAPGLPPDLPVRIERLRPGQPIGRFDGTEITVDRQGPHLELTIVHEFGHAIDRLAIGDPGNYESSSPQGLMRTWQARAEESAPIQRLRARLQEEMARPQGSQSDIRFMAYLNRDREIFARTYAQWITLRSHDQRLRAQADIQRTEAGPFADVVQWTPEEFAPIAEALDGLFRRLGWLR